MFINLFTSDLRIGAINAARASESSSIAGGWIVAQEISATDKTGAKLHLMVHYEPDSPVYKQAVSLALSKEAHTHKPEPACPNHALQEACE